jgi:hypothetical protein
MLPVPAHKVFLAWQFDRLQESHDFGVSKESWFLSPSAGQRMISLTWRLKQTMI